MSECLTHVVKRTGAVVPFNRERIVNAIYRAAVAVGGRDRQMAEGLADEVVAILGRTCTGDKVPTVEEIQDIVEKVLIERGHARTAKAYILYRRERAMRRERRREVRTQRDPENIPYRKLWEVLNWSVDHNVHNIFGSMSASPGSLPTLSASPTRPMRRMSTMRSRVSSSDVRPCAWSSSPGPRLRPRRRQRPSSRNVWRRRA